MQNVKCKAHVGLATYILHSSHDSGPSLGVMSSVM